MNSSDVSSDGPTFSENDSANHSTGNSDGLSPQPLSSEDSPSQPTPADWLKSSLEETVWSNPSMQRVPSMDTGNILAYYYDSVMYKGVGTRVFAYIGYPANASATNKVPAVVLAHGGLGTAYAAWVKKWNDRGYAAIAMDLEGRMPDAAGGETASKRIENGGLSNTYMNDSNLNLDEQWMYQAVSNVILANSILQSDSKIDSSKIGLTGISWGAFISSIVIGVDNRFAFAVPVYGSGYLIGTACGFGKLFANNETAADVWEPSRFIRYATIPILWLNGDSDPHFAPIATSDSYKNSKMANLALLPNFTHSQWDGTSPEEIYAFAASIVNNQKPIIKVTVQPTKDLHSLTMSIPKDISAVIAVLRYTENKFDYNSSSYVIEWKQINAIISGNKITFDMPVNTKYFYVAITDSRNLRVSSQVVSN
ncbi:MAG: alpha/beta hydrolase family protein [Saccharofermentanales bacterium]